MISGLLLSGLQAQIPTPIQRLIEAGEYTTAQQLMRLELATNPILSATTRLDLQFECERLDRIKLDFTKDLPEVLTQIQKHIPDVAAADITRWENEKSLEFLIIDGQKKYFKRAAANLFLIDKAAKARKQKNTPPAVSTPEAANTFRLETYLEDLVKKPVASKTKYLSPKRFRITYTLTVDPEITPAGKVIRAWLPFPRERQGHQTNIKLLTTEPTAYLLADNGRDLQRTIYFEKITQADAATQFQVCFEYQACARFERVDAQKIQPLTQPAKFAPFLAERPPHIIFTPELQQLTATIIGGETNPYLRAQKIFAWIDANIPWASAREYSTIPNISQYCLQQKHGDCGIQTLLFMTLCRIAGIPTKWQSGWSTEPQGVNMHDWGEMYFEPYGWLPVDASYGLRQSDNAEVHWFYFGNIDAYRLVVNDDYSQPLFPAKIFPRSETVDFQRGEVEWDGGNLYFNQWDYEFKVDYLD